MMSLTPHFYQFNTGGVKVSCEGGGQVGSLSGLVRSNTKHEIHEPEITVNFIITNMRGMSRDLSTQLCQESDRTLLDLAYYLVDNDPSEKFNPTLCDKNTPGSHFSLQLNVGASAQ